MGDRSKQPTIIVRLALACVVVAASAATVMLAGGSARAFDAESHGVTPETAAQMHLVLGTRPMADLFPPQR